MKKLIWLAIIGALAYFFLVKKNVVGKILGWFDFFTDYLTRFEGFRENPYWDYKQWSWGYGTKVPGSGTDATNKPDKTISKLEAMGYAHAHALADYNYLLKHVTADLTARQWGALLSFAYNLGPGAADDLAPVINTGQWATLKQKWLSYNKAGGSVNEGLKTRRAYEFEQFSKDIKTT